MPHIKKGSLCTSIADSTENEICIALDTRVLKYNSLYRCLTNYQYFKKSLDYGRYGRDEVNLLADASLIFWHEEE